MSNSHASEECSFVQTAPTSKRRQTDLEWFVEVVGARQARLGLPELTMADVRWFMNLMSQRRPML